ncbi:hypothetical protein HDU91_006209 [Kappamyces sp. JEL0680]|nr:hypothetical protein HDU91_006209 [Kappamyces sp. JEL0680]
MAFLLHICDYQHVYGDCLNTASLAMADLVFMGLWGFTGLLFLSALALAFYRNSVQQQKPLRDWFAPLYVCRLLFLVQCLFKIAYHASLRSIVFSAAPAQDIATATTRTILLWYFWFCFNGAPIVLCVETLESILGIMDKTAKKEHCFVVIDKIIAITGLASLVLVFLFAFATSLDMFVFWRLLYFALCVVPNLFLFAPLTVKSYFVDFPKAMAKWKYESKTMSFEMGSMPASLSRTESPSRPTGHTSRGIALQNKVFLMRLVYFSQLLAECWTHVFASTCAVWANTFLDHQGLLVVKIVVESINWIPPVLFFYFLDVSALSNM